MEHTKEPWTIWDGPLYQGGGADLCIGAGDQWITNMDHRATLPEYHPETGEETGWVRVRQDECDIASWGSEGAITAEQRANAARIVACVNACAGIPDPAAAVERAREALREAAAHHGYWCSRWGGDPAATDRCDCHVAACEEALRALTPEGE